MAHAEPEQEAVVERVREHARRVRGRDGVARPDVRDARGDAEALGRCEQHGAVRERLARAEALRVPERVVAELLDLTRGGPRIGGGRDVNAPSQTPILPSRTRETLARRGSRRLGAVSHDRRHTPRPAPAPLVARAAAECGVAGRTGVSFRAGTPWLHARGDEAVEDPVPAAVSGERGEDTHGRSPLVRQPSPPVAELVRGQLVSRGTERGVRGVEGGSPAIDHPVAVGPREGTRRLESAGVHRVGHVATLVATVTSGIGETGRTCCGFSVSLPGGGSECSHLPVRLSEPEDDARRHAAGLDVLDRLVDLGERPRLADDPGPARPRAARRPRAGRARVPTIEPTTVMPFSTVSKIGSSTCSSAGRPTKTSVPPRRSEPYACSNALRRDGERDRRVGAAEPLDRRGRVVLGRVDGELGAELARELELLVDDVDGDDAAAGDPRVLQGEMAEPADAEDGDEVGSAACPETLTALYVVTPAQVSGAASNGIDAVGHLDDVARVRPRVLGEAAVDRVAGVPLLEAQRLPAGDAVVAVPHA